MITTERLVDRFLPRHLILAAISIAVCGLPACTKKTTAPNPQVQTGVASWYGRPFDGRLTANGETFDMTKMTAAHRTFPFGTVLKVENLTNGKQSEVRINDRGPFVQGRIIDLSQAAAQSISMPGIADVRLTVLSVPTRRGADVFAVQAGAYPQKSDAEKARAQLAARFPDVNLVYRDLDKSWSVLVGHQPDPDSAEALAKQVERESGSPTFVVMLDE